MLIYGDAVRHEAAGRKLQLISDALSAAIRQAPGLERHGKLVGALIEAGELAQGLADTRSPASAAAMSLVQAMARRCALSWDSGFECAGPPMREEEFAACAAPLSPGEHITSKLGEGY